MVTPMVCCGSAPMAAVSLDMTGKLQPEHGILKEHEPLRMGADSSKAEKLLGWRKRLPPKETIRNYIRWRKLNNP